MGPGSSYDAPMAGQETLAEQRTRPTGPVRSLPGPGRSPSLFRDPHKLIAYSRAGVCVLLVIVIGTYRPVRGFETPDLVPVLAAAVVVVLLGVSAIQLWGPAWGRNPIFLLVADCIAVLALVGIYSFDPRKVLFLLLSSGVITEAAILVGLGGALFVWTALSVAYIGREAFADAYLDVTTDAGSILFALSIGLGAALVTGSFARAARATHAFEHERRRTERLQEADEMKNTFLQAVSHDLRNPLTAILGFATTLEKRGDTIAPDLTQQMYRMMGRSARKLDRMLNDLLDLDRLNRGIIRPLRQKADIAELVLRICDDIDLPDRTITVEAQPREIAVDSAKIERIVENLLFNAAKYTPPDTPILVRVDGEQDGVVIAVEDRGPGIPDEHKSSLFEPFKRLPGAEKGPSGSGIGLSLVSRFAHLHGGRAWIADREGGGASFCVFLPDVPPGEPPPEA
jgi:signal transduction histidine kinase